MSFIIVAKYEDDGGAFNPIKDTVADKIVGTADTMSKAEAAAKKVAPREFARGATDILIYDPVRSVRPQYEVVDTKSKPE